MLSHQIFELTTFHIHFIIRSIYAVYENDVTVSGIAGKRFTVPKKVFGSYSENPENRCFCRNLDSDNITTHCYEAGILDQRPCYGGKHISIMFELSSLIMIGM